MKKNVLYISGLALVAVSAAYLIKENIEKEISYQPRTQEAQIAAKGFNDAAEFYNKLRINVNTGKFEAADYFAVLNELKMILFEKNAGLVFSEEGPDNIGGRTRAIEIHPSNINRVFAGAITGGLFVSNNKGNTWQRVQAFDDAADRLCIASIAITPNGTIYVATGASSFEGGLGSATSGTSPGNGIYYSTDNAATFQHLTGTSNWDVNKVIADKTKPNKVWACAQGQSLKPIENFTVGAVPSGLGVSTNIQDVKISNDGNHLVCGGVSGSYRTYVSNDGGLSFVDKSGTGPGQVVGSGISRTEYAISHEKLPAGSQNPGAYTMMCAMSRSNGSFGGSFFSYDNGATWTQVIPGGSTLINPFGTSLSQQGNYNNVITNVPGRPGEYIIGGIDLWKYEPQSNSNLTSGNFNRISLWYAPPFTPIYVHADNHRLTWDNDGRLYIGNDGGIGQSLDKGNIFFPSNRGYNVTQFYAIAYDKHGNVMGGTQDNGTLYKDGTGTTAYEFRDVVGGDGFQCEISYMNSKAMFASIYYSQILRSDDAGNNWTGINLPVFGGATIGQNAGSFFTVLRLWEDPKDEDSRDTLSVVLMDALNLGDTLTYFSNTFSKPLTWISDGNYLANDTLHLIDSVQSIFAVATGGIGQNNRVLITRGGLNFSSSPQWWEVLGPNQGNTQDVKCLEFSKDGNILYVGTWGGRVYRIKGLDSAYTQNYAETQLDVQLIHTMAQAITSIAVDKQSPGRVVITAGGYGASTNILLSTNADVTTNTTGNFVSIRGNLPAMPMFGAIIDRDNPNTVVVGTEFGVYSSTNVGSGNTWASHNEDLGLVPVFDVRQDWRTFFDGSKYPGAIYLGTHGRGIWSSRTLVNIPNYTSFKPKIEGFELTLFPNPVSSIGNVGFDLAERSDVEVRIFSIQGQLMDSYRWAGLIAGSHQRTFNADKLAQGTYMLQMTVGKKQQVVKFIKQ
ncbi:MAG: T9SS type A sorting domain-containing protein [Flavobacteriales bacterium]